MGEVVCDVFLATDDLLLMEQLVVHSTRHFINEIGFKVYEDGTGNVLPCTGFTKEGVEGTISSLNSLVTSHLAIRLDTALEIVKLPISIANI
ncbi:hypothetical protein Syun_014780 [Stephania yunnanensis]|uniref:Uncharacterized protein n=1 Tax=Stephania yunnanensis TaxID=152371 RepID=A0AAP0JM52_9MAGN